VKARLFKVGNAAQWADKCCTVAAGSSPAIRPDFRKLSWLKIATSAMLILSPKMYAPGLPSCKKRKAQHEKPCRFVYRQS
jgi:hypothetical protein